MNWVFLVITSLVVACGFLSLVPHSTWVPWPGIEPASLAGRILNHWARGSLTFDFLSHSFLSTEAHHVPWEVWILSPPHSSLGTSQASSAASICRHPSLLVTVSRKRSFPLMISPLLCVISASHPQGVLRPRGGKQMPTYSLTSTWKWPVVLRWKALARTHIFVH